MAQMLEVRLTLARVLEFKQEIKGLVPETTDTMHGFLSALALLGMNAGTAQVIATMLFGQELYLKAVHEVDVRYDEMHGEGASQVLRAAMGQPEGQA